VRRPWLSAGDLHIRVCVFLKFNACPRKSEITRFGTKCSRNTEVGSRVSDYKFRMLSTSAYREQDSGAFPRVSANTHVVHLTSNGFTSLSTVSGKLRFPSDS
jgi:hypothetical protein